MRAHLEFQVFSAAAALAAFLVCQGEYKFPKRVFVAAAAAAAAASSLGQHLTQVI